MKIPTAVGYVNDKTNGAMSAIHMVSPGIISKIRFAVSFFIQDIYRAPSKPRMSMNPRNTNVAFIAINKEPVRGTFFTVREDITILIIIIPSITANGVESKW